MPKNPRIRRRRQSVTAWAAQNAPKSTLEALTASQTARAVQRVISAEIGRVTQSDAEIDAAAIVTDDDVAAAVDLWDEAQTAHETGLEGLLSARADDGQ